jgi:hypothetical protein
MRYSSLVMAFIYFIMSLTSKAAPDQDGTTISEQPD